MLAERLEHAVAEAATLTVRVEQLEGQLSVAETLAVGWAARWIEADGWWRGELSGSARQLRKAEARIKYEAGAKRELREQLAAQVAGMEQAVMAATKRVIGAQKEAAMRVHRECVEELCVVQRQELRRSVQSTRAALQSEVEQQRLQQEEIVRQMEWEWEERVQACVAGAQQAEKRTRDVGVGTECSWGGKRSVGARVQQQSRGSWVRRAQQRKKQRQRASRVAKYAAGMTARAEGCKTVRAAGRNVTVVSTEMFKFRAKNKPWD